MDKKNIYENIPFVLPDEVFENILDQPTFRLERIVSMEHSTPEGEWYDQDKNEWVILLRGSASLRLEERAQPITLKPGDYIFLPAHCRHRVEWTARNMQTIWLTIHY